MYVCCFKISYPEKTICDSLLDQNVNNSKFNQSAEKDVLLFIEESY